MSDSAGKQVCPDWSSTDGFVGNYLLSAVSNTGGGLPTGEAIEVASFITAANSGGSNGVVLFSLFAAVCNQSNLSLLYVIGGSVFFAAGN